MWSTNHWTGTKKYCAVAGMTNNKWLLGLSVLLHVSETSVALIRRLGNTLTIVSLGMRRGILILFICYWVCKDMRTMSKLAEHSNEFCTEQKVSELNWGWPVWSGDWENKHASQLLMKNVRAYEGKQQGVLEGRLREKREINSNTVMLENRIERSCLFWGWLLTARDTLKKMKKWFLIKRWFTGAKSFW